MSKVYALKSTIRPADKKKMAACFIFTSSQEDFFALCDVSFEIKQFQKKCQLKGKAVCPP